MKVLKFPVQAPGKLNWQLFSSYSGNFTCKWNWHPDGDTNSYCLFRKCGIFVCVFVSVFMREWGQIQFRLFNNIIQFNNNNNSHFII